MTKFCLIDRKKEESSVIPDSHNPGTIVAHSQFFVQSEMPLFFCELKNLCKFLRKGSSLSSEKGRRKAKEGRCATFHLMKKDKKMTQKWEMLTINEDNT